MRSFGSAGFVFNREISFCFLIQIAYIWGKMNELTAKQIRFCEEYLIDLNATQAAIRAGYSEKTANEQGSRLLANVSISEYVKSKQDELSKQAQISAEWVLKRLKEISDRCMTAEPVMIRQGQRMVQKIDEETGEGVWEFDSAGAVRATELLGKHIGFFEKDNAQKGNVITIIPPTKKLKK